MSELIRFFAVTVLGVILDLAVAFALHQWAGVPLWLAAATGWRSTIHNGVGKISCTSCFSIMAESISRDCPIVR